jgi:hypothetical protein
MLTLLNIFGGGLTNLPYPPPDMLMGEYLERVIAPALNIKMLPSKRFKTFPLHVQTYDTKEPIVVFDDETSHKLLCGLIADGSTLFYSTSHVSVNNGGGEELEECVTCLVKMHNEAHTLLCGHTFHVACIQRTPKQCPICATPIDSRDSAYFEWFSYMRLHAIK